ncbi:MAG: DPP IV N-terminal domain-containing protein, partial [Gammaproteobacteria bacterium]
MSIKQIISIRLIGVTAVTLVIGCLLVANTVVADTSPARFTLNNIFDLQWAQDPRISPDGRQVVFVRGSFNRMNDKARHSLWLVNTDGTGLRPLTDPDLNATSPRWSPDGKRLLYVTGVKGEGAEIRVRYMASGTTARLASLEHGPSELSWSPDGHSIAFAMFVPATPRQPMAKMPSPPKGADWGPPIKVIDRLMYRFNGEGYLPRGRTHLFVLPAEGGTPRQVTDGDVDDDGSLVWTPDSKSLIFTANRHEDAEYQPLNTEVYEVAAAGGDVRALTHRDGPDGSAVVSPDGSHIAYTGFDDRRQGYQVTRLYVMDRDGSHAHVITARLDRDVRNPQWDRRGRGLYFQYDDEGTTRIGHVELDGKVQVLASDVGGLDLGRPYAAGQYSVSAASGVFAFTLTSAEHPADVAVGSRRGGKVRRLTDLNKGLLGHMRLGSLEEIHFPSGYDKRSIEGWLLKPPGFDPEQKYPLLLEIHGGPFANYGPRFSAEDQLYAAAGYVVL